MKRLAIVGAVIALVGLLLVVAYWPLTSVSGPQLRADQSSGGYTGFAVGDTVTIHGTIDNASYLALAGTTVLAIDSGDPNNPVPVLVQGDARPVVTPGEEVYMRATLQSGPLGSLLGIEFWQVSTPSDIHAAWPVNYAFYGAVGLGVVLVVADTLRHRHTAPQG